MVKSLFGAVLAAPLAAGSLFAQAPLALDKPRATQSSAIVRIGFAEDRPDSGPGGPAQAPISPFELPVPPPEAQEPPSRLPSKQPLPGDPLEQLPAPKSVPADPLKSAPIEPPCAPASVTPPKAVPPNRDNFACNLPAGCVRDPNWWVGGDYLRWFIRKGNLPASLATTGPAGTSGALGQRGVRTVVGQTQLDYGSFSGLDLLAGFWLNKEHTVGLEANAFFLEQRQTSLAVAGSSFPVLARPFLDTAVQKEDVRTLALPGAFSGGLAVASASQLWGAELNPVLRLLEFQQVRLDILVGLRYLDLKEDLNIYDVAAVQSGATAAFNGEPVFGPAATFVVDHFGTRNQFYGGQVGGRVGLVWNKIAVDVTGKLALGSTHEIVTTYGSTTLAKGAPGAVTTAGGLLAVARNRGSFSEDRFAVVPELGLKVGYQVNQSISLVAGYSVLYLSDVVRPGEQVSRAVNSTQVPTSPNFGASFGPAALNVPLARTDFLAHGVSVGLVVKY